MATGIAHSNALGGSGAAKADMHEIAAFRQ